MRAITRRSRFQLGGVAQLAPAAHHPAPGAPCLESAGRLLDVLVQDRVPTKDEDGVGGEPHFSYHDSHRTLEFAGNQIERAEVPDLGTVVSVTLLRSVDSGWTSFSVLLPRVNLGQ